jgi:hypothetical protein
MVFIHAHFRVFAARRAPPPPTVSVTGDDDLSFLKRKAPPPPPQIATHTFNPAMAVSYSSDLVNWALKLRKEIFMPSESLDHPVAIELVFRQVRGCG